MAYRDIRQNNGRAPIVVAVALLHGAAIYALVSGFGVEYLREVMPTFKTHNVPVEPPPPEPQPRPSTQAKPRDVIVVPRPGFEPLLPRDPAPPSGPLEGGVVDPVPHPLPTATFTPPPRPEPSMAPRAARPRGKPGLWVTSADYPARDLREGNQGTVGFMLTIGADGRVQSCVVTATSGHPGLDAATCALVSRRARFEPATDSQGLGTVGSYGNRVRWEIPAD